MRQLQHPNSGIFSWSTAENMHSTTTEYASYEILLIMTYIRGSMQTLSYLTWNLTSAVSKRFCCEFLFKQCTKNSSTIHCTMHDGTIQICRIPRNLSRPSHIHTAWYLAVTRFCMSKSNNAEQSQLFLRWQNSTLHLIQTGEKAWAHIFVPLGVHFQ